MTSTSPGDLLGETHSPHLVTGVKKLSSPGGWGGGHAPHLVAGVETLSLPSDWVAGQPHHQVAYLEDTLSSLIAGVEDIFLTWWLKWRILSLPGDWVGGHPPHLVAYLEDTLSSSGYWGEGHSSHMVAGEEDCPHLLAVVEGILLTWWLVWRTLSLPYGLVGGHTLLT
jgi:hypothetical protein